ncbi:hypothetical protein D3C87_1114290 [compost metagenome]
MAPQLIATNGPLRRLDASWIACAASSLPVPDSPEIKTGASLWATLASERNITRMTLQSPIIGPCGTCSGARTPCRLAMPWACLSVYASSSNENGVRT